MTSPLTLDALPWQEHPTDTGWRYVVVVVAAGESAPWIDPSHNVPGPAVVIYRRSPSGVITAWPYDDIDDAYGSWGKWMPAPVDVRGEKVAAKRELPPGCTGALHPDGTITHDGPTCPVHEEVSA